MESTITGTVGEVVGRTVNTSRGQATVFDVQIGGQKVSTFKSDIAEQANALKGSEVEATVTVTQKGDYTNYTLMGVKLVDAGGAKVHTPSSTIPVTAAPQNDYQRPMRPEDAARVTFLSCLNAAAQVYCGSADEDAVLALAKTFYGAVMGTKKQEEPVAAVAAPTETSDDVPW